jgi:hypothetical protein
MAHLDRNAARSAAMSRRRVQLDTMSPLRADADEFELHLVKLNHGATRAPGRLGRRGDSGTMGRLGQRAEAVRRGLGGGTVSQGGGHSVRPTPADGAGLGKRIGE